MERTDIGKVGFVSGALAAAATLAYGVVQSLQIAAVLHFPWDEALVYSTSLCIVIPFLLEMLALHHLTPEAGRFHSHAALLFSVLYAVFVTANYVVQLVTVLPAKLSGTLESVRVLDQTPHSMFWCFDALGYMFMGLAAGFALLTFERGASFRRVRMALLAHVAVTPLITVVYFYPRYSYDLLLLGLPWGFTAPTFMLALGYALRTRARALPVGA